MEQLYALCLERLRSSGLTEAARKPGRFFRLETEKTAFILNLSLVENAYLHVEYGLTSTAFFAFGEGDRKFFLDMGQEGNDCTLRASVDICGEEDVPAAEEAIRSFYREYHETEKDALLELARQRRKEFIGQIAALLKPLKFRKKGNRWQKTLENGLILEFYAQKSAFSDQYYFNIDLGPDPGKLPYACMRSRIVAGGTDIYDWQLLDREALLKTIETGIEQYILPFLGPDFSALGRENWVWKKCTCNRTRCASCWVEKNLWGK